MFTHRSFLAELIDGWQSNGWPIDDLHRFRMEGEGDSSDDGAGDDTSGGDDTSNGNDDGASGGDSKDDKSGDDTDWKAEAEKWRTQSRKHEDRAKKTQRELEKVTKDQMSDGEKALTEAEERGRKAAAADAAQKLAAAEIKAALAGVVPDPKAIVEDLNLAKYVTDDNEVDEDAVKVLREKYASFSKPGKASGSADGGSRGDDKPKRAGSIEEAVNKKLGASA